MHGEIFYYLILLLIVQIINGSDEVCNKKPLGSKTGPLPPDDRFLVEIVGVDDKYIPGRKYTVHLHSRESNAKFIAFTIIVKGDEKSNDKNVRKPILLDPGKLGLKENSNDVIVNTDCEENVLIQSNLTPKNSVEATWTAPPKGNKCVTLSAVVAIKRDVWFSSEGPLSKRVCEDLRKAEDMQPIENDNCKACGDARYLLTFEGTWSSNTHPTMFPAPEARARFSDVVGAAHNKNFNVYKFNSEASQGLQMLAEQGNTTVLEREIVSNLGTDVRTVIKATGPLSPNMSTIAMFRVSPDHHLVSLVSAVLPSPDWFLGVANFELCDAVQQKWTEHSLLNLYLLDAGTDSGKSFTAANEVTSPPVPISSADILKDLPKEVVKPFARLKFDLIRTYEKKVSECLERKIEETQNKDENDVTEVFTIPATETYYPPSTVQASNPDDICPVTEWQSWSPCAGECGQLGTQIRTRDRIVNGIPIGSYKENAPIPVIEEPEECNDIDTSEFQDCEVLCDDTDDTLNLDQNFD